MWRETLRWHEEGRRLKLNRLIGRAVTWVECSRFTLTFKTDFPEFEPNKFTPRQNVDVPQLRPSIRIILFKEIGIKTALSGLSELSPFPLVFANGAPDPILMSILFQNFFRIIS